MTERTNRADRMLLFLVATTSSIALTRAYLQLFDYPQLAHGQFHIAHALFGAILLTVANILLITSRYRHTHTIAAFIGGLGCGQMLDEVGKFISKDSNYFFQPAPIFIYFGLVCLFLAYWRVNMLEKKEKLGAPAPKLRSERILLFAGLIISSIGLLVLL